MNQDKDLKVKVREGKEKKVKAQTVDIKIKNTIVILVYQIKRFQAVVALQAPKYLLF